MNVEAFLDTLPIMAKGMLGIFLVTIIIILVIMIMNKMINVKKSRLEEQSIKQKDNSQE